MVKPDVDKEDFVNAALESVWDSFSVGFSGGSLTCFVGPAKQSWDYSTFGRRTIEKGETIGFMLHIDSRSPRKTGYILDPSYILDNTYPLTQLVQETTRKRVESAEYTPEFKPCFFCRYQTHKHYHLLTKRFTDVTYKSNTLQPHCQSCLEQIEADIYAGFDDKRKLFVESFS